MPLAIAASTPGVVVAVVICSLAAAGVCLACAVWFAYVDDKPAQAVRDAAQEAGAKTKEKLQNPTQPQVAAIDFGGLAKLAEGLARLNRSGRFLIGALGFAAVAAVAAGAGAIGVA